MSYPEGEKPLYEQTTLPVPPPPVPDWRAPTELDRSTPLSWPPPPRPRVQQGLPKRTRILAIILAALLVVGALALFIYSATNQYGRALGAQDGSDATGTARSRSQSQATSAVEQSATAGPLGTLQAQILATATAQAQPTAAAEATAAQGTVTAQAMLAALTQVTNNTATLSDPLSDNSQGNAWDVGYTDNNDTGCNFVSGSYQVLEALQTFLRPCFADATNFSNFVYQVSMTFSSNCAGGLLLRGNKSSGQYYLFTVDAKGSYTFELYNKSSYTLLASGTSAAILGGAGQANSLAIMANQDVFDLFVNQTYLTEITNSQLSKGQIGVAVYNTGLPASVSFSNAQVWKIAS
jgi:flagellar basal body-associated protein FliL